MKTFLPYILASITLALTLPSILHSELVQFAFTGFVPVGASNHLHVSDGESFVAVFIVDNSTVDSAPARDLGSFGSAVVSGEFTFSGGYVFLVDLGSPIVNRVAVGENFNFPSISAFDAVQVVAFSPDPNTGNVVNVIAINTTDLSSLNSDSIPNPGTSIFSDTAGEPFVQLHLVEDHGTVSYGTCDAANINLVISSVPVLRGCQSGWVR